MKNSPVFVCMVGLVYCWFTKLCAYSKLVNICNNNYSQYKRHLFHALIVFLKKVSVNKKNDIPKRNKALGSL